MTTIAYRNGVLAADTSLSTGGCLNGRVTKIAARDNDLAGVAGSAAFGAAFLKWFTDGEVGDPPKGESHDDSFDRGVIFRAGGPIEVYEPLGRFDVEADYYAFGSGRSEALGAMFAGADASTGVLAAMQHDANTAGEIMILRQACRSGVAEDPQAEYCHPRSTELRSPSRATRGKVPAHGKEADFAFALADGQQQ